MNKTIKTIIILLSLTGGANAFTGQDCIDKGLQGYMPVLEINACDTGSVEACDNLAQMEKDGDLLNETTYFKHYDSGLSNYCEAEGYIYD